MAEGRGGTRQNAIECMFKCAKQLGMGEPLFEIVEADGKKCVNLTPPCERNFDVQKLASVDMPPNVRLFIVKDDAGNYSLHFCENGLNHLPFTDNENQQAETTAASIAESAFRRLREGGRASETWKDVIKRVVDYLGPSAEGAEFYLRGGSSGRFGTAAPRLEVELHDDEVDRHALTNLLADTEVEDIRVWRSKVVIGMLQKSKSKREARPV